MLKFCGKIQIGADNFLKLVYFVFVELCFETTACFYHF